MAFGNGVFVCGGYRWSGGAALATSVNGKDWVANAGIHTGSQIMTVAYDGKGMFVATGYMGLVITSTDVVNWVAKMVNKHHTLDGIRGPCVT